MHHLPWPRASTYNDVSALYVEFVKYGSALVVIDRYEDGPSISDELELVIMSKKDNKQQFMLRVMQMYSHTLPPT